MFHTDLFAYSEKSLHPWDKFQLIVVYNPFTVLLDLVCSYLSRIFAPMFISDTGLYIFCMIFVWFWCQGDSGLIEWVGECSFLCNCGKSFRRVDVNSSQNIWRNSPLKPSDPGCLFVVSFLIILQFSIFDCSVHSSYFPWFNFGRLYLSKNFSISSRLSISLA